MCFSFPSSSYPCRLGPCHKRRTGGCCTQLGSLSALKHAVLGLYLLVFLILVGIFILAGRSTLFCPGLERCGRSYVGSESRQELELEPPLFSLTVVSPNAALLAMATVKEERQSALAPQAPLLAALPVSFGMTRCQGLCEFGKSESRNRALVALSVF